MCVRKYKIVGVDLPGPVNDIASVAKLLAQKERRTFPRVERRELLDHQATRAHVESVLGAMVAKAKPQDLILLYFSGHAMRNSAPTDTNGGTRAGAQSGETAEKGEAVQQVSLVLHDFDYKGEGQITQPEPLAAVEDAKAERLVVILDF